MKKIHPVSIMRTMLLYIRAQLFPHSQQENLLRICVPITGFPVTGGTRAVLAKIAQVMEDSWQMEYLAQYIAPHKEKLVVTRFGTKRMAPWQFPAVWLYVLAGLYKLLSLQHHGSNYDVILPQDGVFTAAFAALAAKIAGIRVICIDHGNLTLLSSRSYRAERMQALANRAWSRRLLAHLQYLVYWPSLLLLAHIAARYVDHFLVPGVSGDGVEEICTSLGIPASRLTRFATMIDCDRYQRLEASLRAEMRAKHGIATNAIVVTMLCRLAPEKGIDIALEALSSALSTLSPSIREQVQVIIAGDGPLRDAITKDILKRGLQQTISLRGEISVEEACLLLGISDIFLYTSRRGACLSVAVLEAMASGCAVIATPLPRANASMLAEERGIIVSPGNALEVGRALQRLLNDRELCYRMGNLAREYVRIEHSAAQFRRALLKATSFSDEMCEGKPVAAGKG